MKYVLIALILLDYAWVLCKYVLSKNQKKKPLPACVQGVYDDEQYAKWREYVQEKGRFSLITNTLMTVVTVILFAFDLFAVVYDAIGISGMWGDVILMSLFCVLSTLLSLPSDYLFTFRIEEKYGFNRSTKATFWVDNVKQTILNLFLMNALMLGAASFSRTMGPWMGVGIFVVLSFGTILSSFFALHLQKLFYKFTPLPEGNLRSRLEKMFTDNGYRVKKIYVMNASKRTTRANAFCAGLGKGKKIALFDNLVDNYSEDEITAVFAHELGHAKHHDTFKLVSLQLLVYAAMSAAISLMMGSEVVSQAMGFEVINAAGVFIALSAVVLGPLMTVVMAPLNAFSRHFERKADTFAVENGMGDAMISALSRISRDNFADLNPHPFLSAIGDSHPTLGERIQVIRAAQEKQGNQSDAS